VTGDELGNGVRLEPQQRGAAQLREGEALQDLRRDEPTPATVDLQHPTWKELMEEVVAPANIARAMKRVLANKGSPGIDRMTVDELPERWRRNEALLREQLLAGTYKPTPVRRVTIPKSGGGERELGIPTVTDRLVQQAILQVLGPRYDAGFSTHSHGFRPNHSAHDAVIEAQRYIQEGYDWVVDVDLERFFDRVNHDVLMGRLARKIEDKRMLKILRGFLNAGVMLNGVVIDKDEGTPQGGPLSPLLANVLLDEIDKLLEARSSLRPLRRRLQRIRAVATCRRTRDGHDAQGAIETPTADQRGQECGRSAVESAIPRLYVSRPRPPNPAARVTTRHREGQGSNTRADESEPRCEHRHRRERAGDVLEGLVAVFRTLSGPSIEAHP
jgi:retron-type reverse transcriptase